MTEARATLTNSSGNTYDMPPKSGESIPDGFSTAYVHQGTWIFYDSSYNSNYSNNVKVLREGSGNVSLGFNARSAREVRVESDAICLFEHYNYCGVMKVRMARIFCYFLLNHVRLYIMLVDNLITELTQLTPNGKIDKILRKQSKAFELETIFLRLQTKGDRKNEE